MHHYFYVFDASGFLNGVVRVHAENVAKTNVGVPEGGSIIESGEPLALEVNFRDPVTGDLSFVEREDD